MSWGLTDLAAGQELSGLLRRLQAANLPRDTWQATRDSAVIRKSNDHVLDAVTLYLHDLSRSLAAGKGFTFIGPRNAGKTFWGSVILRSVLAMDGMNVLRMEEDYRDVARVDYHDLLSQSFQRGELPALFQTVRSGRVVFLDNLHGPAVTSPIYAALSARRDAGLPTFLGVLANGSGELESHPAWGVIQKFDRVNHRLVLPESILDYLPEA
jgi:hypothetical protein